MIDHVSVGVADLDRAARFYEAALATLGLTRLVTRPATIGFGKNYLARACAGRQSADLLDSGLAHGLLRRFSHEHLR
jgi:catechol 2,3-dioxygenase-like lactoylglutathione lyase family enzyme